MRRLVSGIAGAVTLAACGSNDGHAELSCGSPMELTSVAERAEWERSIRDDVYAVLSAVHPDAEYERLTRQSDEISGRLERMAEQFGDLDGGGWCDEACQRRGVAYDHASAELRDQLTEVDRRLSDRRRELDPIMQQHWDEEVSITASEASTISTDEVARSLLCDARLEIVIGSATRFERTATYRSTETGLVELLSVRSIE